MKLTNAIKLLSQYGKVKQDETGARIEINGWTYGASTNWNEQEVLFLYCECGTNTRDRHFYSYNLKSSVEMMADYLDSLGFDFRGHKEEVLMPIYEEFERRQK